MSTSLNPRRLSIDVSEELFWQLKDKRYETKRTVSFIVREILLRELPHYVHKED